MGKPVRFASLRFASLLAKALPAATLVAALACVNPAYAPCHETCEGNLRHACTSRDYIGSRQDGIEDCGPSRRCVEATRSYGYYAACALNGGPDPLCQAEGEVQFCDGERIAFCHGAYRVNERDCAADGLVCETVVLNGRGRPACVKSHQREARCEVDLTRVTTFCDGDTVVECVGGFARDGGRCQSLPGGGRCIDVSDPACAEKGMRCLEARCVP